MGERNHFIREKEARPFPVPDAFIERQLEFLGGEKALGTLAREESFPV